MHLPKPSKKVRKQKLLHCFCKKTKRAIIFERFCDFGLIKINFFKENSDCRRPSATLPPTWRKTFAPSSAKHILAENIDFPHEIIMFLRERCLSPQRRGLGEVSQRGASFMRRLFRTASVLDLKHRRGRIYFAARHRLRLPPMHLPKPSKTLRK